MKDGSIYRDCFRTHDTVEKQPRKTNCFTKRIRCGCCDNYFQSHPYYTKDRREVQYEALLTTPSIKRAQEYYSLLKKVKAGETKIRISEDVKKVLPDFPKAAITYSLSENEDGSQVNQEKMAEALTDYNEMFGTHFDVGQINGYNKNLNERLARKESRYKSREQQLDLVIVVDRLLTGFDAPCLSTLFIERQPMNPHDIV